jgi:RNA polymerase sigma-70 factor (ECF subfamily)
MVVCHPLGTRTTVGCGILSTPIEQLSDLVSRIEAGDRVAEVELFEQYGSGIRLILLKRTGNAQLASDLCQDTFVVALRKLRAGEIRNRRSVAAFVRQIAVNISIDYYRKERRYVHPRDGIISLPLSHKDRQSNEIDEQTVRMAIERALEQLAVPRDREVLRRFYLADEDKDQICRDLQLSATHFDKVLYRARRRMRELINQHPRLKELLIGGLHDA